MQSASKHAIASHSLRPSVTIDEFRRSADLSTANDPHPSPDRPSPRLCTHWPLSSCGRLTARCTGYPINLGAAHVHLLCPANFLPPKSWFACPDSHILRCYVQFPIDW